MIVFQAAAINNERAAVLITSRVPAHVDFDVMFMVLNMNVVLKVPETLR